MLLMLWRSKYNEISKRTPSSEPKKSTKKPTGGLPNKSIKRTFSSSATTSKPYRTTLVLAAVGTPTTFPRIYTLGCAVLFVSTMLYGVWIGIHRPTIDSFHVHEDLAYIAIDFSREIISIAQNSILLMDKVTLGEDDINTLRGILRVLEIDIRAFERYFHTVSGLLVQPTINREFFTIFDDFITE